jgi:hypothetical protein
MIRVLRAMAEARRTMVALTDHALVWCARQLGHRHCTHRQTHNCEGTK